MKANLFAITPNAFNPNAIFKLQEKIEADEMLKACYWQPPRPVREAWDTLYPKLYQDWLGREEEKYEVKSMYDYLSMHCPTFFGHLTFYNNIIRIRCFGQKLEAFKYNYDLQQQALDFHQCLCLLLNQKQLIYYGDLEAKSSWIKEKVYGGNFNTILEMVPEKHNLEKQNMLNSIMMEDCYIQLL